jgi:hypothetical protein
LNWFSTFDCIFLFLFLSGFLGLKNGLERNNVLVNMPVPVFDISDLLKNEKPESALQVQQVVLQISEYLARNQSPKSKFAQGEDFSQHISLVRVRWCVRVVRACGRLT